MVSEKIIDWDNLHDFEEMQPDYEPKQHRDHGEEVNFNLHVIKRVSDLRGDHSPEMEEQMKIYKEFSYRAKCKGKLL